MCFVALGVETRRPKKKKKKGILLETGDKRNAIG